MSRIDEIRTHLGDEWIPGIYEEKVRSQRTRSFSLGVPARENTAEIFHTLLGIELKVGKKRISCPDLATARYLRVFARLGCSAVAVPYDITKTSPLADRLETAWQRTLLINAADSKELTPAAAARRRSALVREMRMAIETIGAGEAMPEFRQSTRQRNS